MPSLRGFSQESRKAAALVLHMRTRRLRERSHLSMSHGDYGGGGAGAKAETLRSSTRQPLVASRGPGYAAHLCGLAPGTLSSYNLGSVWGRGEGAFFPLLLSQNYKSSTYLKPGDGRRGDMSDRLRRHGGGGMGCLPCRSRAAGCGSPDSAASSLSHHRGSPVKPACLPQSSPAPIVVSTFLAGH